MRNKKTYNWCLRATGEDEYLPFDGILRWLVVDCNEATVQSAFLDQVPSVAQKPPRRLGERCNSSRRCRNPVDKRQDIE